MNKRLHADTEYRNRLEENFLSHIGYEHVENLCNELDQDSEHWNDLKIPESLDAWFADFFKQEQKRKRRQKNRVIMMRAAKRAAVIVLLLVGVNYFLVANVEAYRIQFLNTIMNIQHSFTKIDYSKEQAKENNTVPRNWEGKYYPAYITGGYWLDMAEKHSNSAILQYVDNTGDRIILQEFSADSSLSIDSESGNVTRIIVGEDDQAVYIEKENTKFICWKLDDSVFQIEGTSIDLKELIKIAESLERMKE